MTTKSRFLWLVILLVACSPASTSRDPIEPAAAPMIQSAEQAAGVVEAFLTAWNTQDFETMYSYISPRSRELYPLPVFTSRYEVVDKDINFTGVTFTIGDTQTQGTTAIVTYEVQIDSPFFGVIEDEGREMRLIQTPEGWRIAWTTMDIFEGLAAGARITVDSRFPPRANIYDRSGQLLVEEGGTMVALYAIQQNMRGVDDCIDLLSGMLLTPRRDIVKLFSNYLEASRFFLAEIDLSTFVARRGELEAVCGVDIAEQRTARAYYGHGALAHVTGYIGQIPADQVDRWQSRGYRPGDLVGFGGVEGSYQDTLAGRAQRFLRITEPGGVTLRELKGTDGQPSTPVTLTIDRDLQMITARAINDAFNYAEQNWGGVSLGAAAVIIDVDTGAIRALVSYPTFNPTIFSPDTRQPDVNYIATLSEDVRQPLVNKATFQQYFPGSVFKVVTTTAAAGEEMIAPDELFFCDLQWDGSRYGDVVRDDWRRTDGFDAAGDITIAQALTASCNPFFWEMGARLYQRSPNLLVDYARRLGLGSRIGLPLDEVSGDLAAPDNISKAINNAVGQGDVRLPPVQLAQMVATIANGGTLYKTHLVERMGGTDNTELSFQAQPEVVGELGVSNEVIDIVREGMCGVTTDSNLGTAEFVFKKIPYTLCGKTGTAQTSLYPNAWFVAYAPAEEPELAIAVVVVSSREGSEVAAPIVRRILDQYFNAPVEDYPEWWNKGPYVPLEIPEGGTRG